MTLPMNEDEIVPLNDPEFLEAQQKREAALQALSDIGQEMEKALRYSSFIKVFTT